MAEIKGTNLAAPIVPYTDQDIYATHEAKYGKGGYRTCQDLEERDSIPNPRREEGMMVYVIDDPTGIHTYQWLNGMWLRNRIGQGIPIMNQELIDEYGIDPTRDTYISVPDQDTDLDGEVSGNNYATSVNGNYVDVLFRAIRSLQSEVARLKNSFTYGIESYSGTQTAMTRAQAELGGTAFPDEEPLWAVEEDGLSQLADDITIGTGHKFTPTDPRIDVNDAVELIIDEDQNYQSYCKFNYPVTYFFDDTAASDDPTAKACTDSKLFFYFTATSLNIKMNLQGWRGDVGASGENPGSLVLDLSRITLPRIPEKGVYNALVVISRAQQMSDGEYYGKNFIWVSIGDPGSDQTITEGYWNDNGLYSLLSEQPLRYIPISVEFSDGMTLSKFKVYSKYQDFSKEIMASKPSEEDYKFKAAHITIRSVDTQETLVSVKDQILNNELIYVEYDGKLWIKTNGKLATISGSSGGGGGQDDDSTMTKDELIVMLRDLGIIYETNNGVEINDLNLEDIVFIHQASGRKYKFSIDADGILHSQEMANDSDKFATRISNAKMAIGDTYTDVRGFIGQFRLAEAGGKRTADAKLNSDRLKIGAFYAPLSNDIVHGCSHSFVELENTSDQDYPLDGCYLHWTGPNISGQQMVASLALTGIIPAGGTYLIRGAKHAEFDDPNVYIKVETFDQEWYYEKSVGNKELLSFEVNEALNLSGNDKGYGFALTYGLEGLAYNTALYKNSASGDTVNGGGTVDTITDTSTYPYILQPGFIDALYYHTMVKNSSGTGYWAPIAVAITSNTMYRNTFELDPAKQAFQAFTTKDSSRARWKNVANDIQVVDLTNEYIAFPHSEDIYAIANYTPKASWEHKNVSTDKTKLDKEKPNMVTTSFGIDIYKTRCFNWISVGYYDEYVWLKKKGASTWAKKAMSYKPIQQIQIISSNASEDSNGNIITTANFRVTTTGFPLGGSLNQYPKLVSSSFASIATVSSVSFVQNTSSYSVTMSGDQTASLVAGTTCYLMQSNDEANTSNGKKFFSADVTNNIYARLTGRFPGDNSFFTSHKVIMDINSAHVSNKEEWVYVVGRADKNGNPDPDHTSEEMSFTLYPDSYKTQIYQITDQQGFTWIEYQVWAAAAEMVNQKIASDVAAGNIIPILLNTGDMTQNGTRINEWFDYYQAGRKLFNHLEQMNVVGNNDLCNTDPFVLGTGDDTGKSNSFYFHLFYCYEVNEEVFTPLLPNLARSNTAPKYIPSFYYFESTTDRFIVLNSEITEINCADWFGLVSGGQTVNAYTGFKIGSTDNSDANYVEGFTTIYSMMYNALSTAGPKKPMVMCHEMPFTVITNESLKDASRDIYRSISNAGALVGSHTNQISKNELNGNNQYPGIYWLSRLCEHFGVKLMLGGHKHTYTCTYPLRERYTYTLGGIQRDSKQGPMSMGSTLKGDTVNFITESNGVTTNTSKFPYALMRTTDIGSYPGGFYPVTPDPDLEGGITYFMCQATGYKLTSNKELPSANQKFSRLLPETTVKNGSDKANDNQKYPMFAIIRVDNGTYNIKLARVHNIFNSSFAFKQKSYSTTDMQLQYLSENSSNNYGTWGSTERPIFDTF